MMVVPETRWAREWYRTFQQFRRQLVTLDGNIYCNGAPLGAGRWTGEWALSTSLNTDIVDGPFAMDNAVSVEAAQIKGIPGEVAGQCDILLVPTVEAGNILVKTFSFLAGGRTAGVVLGAQAPVVLTSRADSAESRVHSIALGIMMHNMQRTSRLKVGRVHF